MPPKRKVEASSAPRRKPKVGDPSKAIDLELASEKLAASERANYLRLLGSDPQFAAAEVHRLHTLYNTVPKMLLADEPIELFAVQADWVTKRMIEHEDVHYLGKMLREIRAWGSGSIQSTEVANAAAILKKLGFPGFFNEIGLKVAAGKFRVDESGMLGTGDGSDDDDDDDDWGSFFDE